MGWVTVSKRRTSATRSNNSHRAMNANEQNPSATNAVPAIPDSEIRVEFTRSSGPGGQNVNKVSSKAQLWWNVGASLAFTEEQKAAIRAYAGNRLNGEDEIMIASQSERAQAQNRDEVVRRLQALVAGALSPKKIRRRTRVSRSQNEQRLEQKRKTSYKKRERKRAQSEW